jgi:hypothetical protein
MYRLIENSITLNITGLVNNMFFAMKTFETKFEFGLLFKYQLSNFSSYFYGFEKTMSIISIPSRTYT